MLRFCLCAMVAALVFSGTPARAREQTVTVDEILSGMEQAEKTIKAVRFSFDQDIVYPLTGERQSLKGEVVFQKPGNLYVRNARPKEQFVISNGRKVWVYTPEFRQAVVDSWKRWMKNSVVPASLVTLSQDWTDMKKKYVFSLQGQEADSYVLLLTPKQKEYWKMKIWVDRKEFTPRRGVLYGEGVEVTMTTTDYQVNPAVDKKLFEFKAPAGTEVIQLP